MQRHVPHNALMPAPPKDGLATLGDAIRDGQFRIPKLKDSIKNANSNWIIGFGLYPA